MNIILLSGGSGKRLWPLSNEVRSKQFIKFFNGKDGQKESMVQRIYFQMKKIDSSAHIIIASSKNQISELKNQLGSSITISVEPFKRDTFPAIVLACCYLKEIENTSNDEPIIVCPVDSYVDDDYFGALIRLSNIVNSNVSNLVLMGIEPIYPSDKFGYIIPSSNAPVSKVSVFKEKPSLNTAKEYIKQGALWNGGIFGFKLGYLLEKAHELLNFTCYKDLYANYGKVNKISFDYAVSEKERSISVMRFAGKWEDLGTWNTLANSMPSPIIGNGTIGEDSRDVHIINELNLPILCIGVNDLIVAASYEGVLVTNKKGASKIKTYVDKLPSTVMFAEKSWGVFQIIDTSPNSLTIKLKINKGCHLSYHYHRKRTEIWTILSGKGRIVIDGHMKNMYVGDSIQIPAGVKHTLYAETDILLIENQIGENIDIKDKEKFNSDKLFV